MCIMRKTVGSSWIPSPVDAASAWKIVLFIGMSKMLMGFATVRSLTNRHADFEESIRQLGRRAQRGS